MYDFRAKLKSASEAISGNSFIRLARGENRKNNLRKSRRICLIVFVCVAAMMCLLYTSISGGAFSLTDTSKRKIDIVEVAAKAEEIKTDIAELEATDTADYNAAELTDFNNRLENERRSVAVLEALLDGAYDGSEYSVIYTDTDGELKKFGTVSFTYNNLYRSYVLDFMTMLIAIFISITVANVFGAEYSEKTVKLMFTKPSSRIKLFLCKMAVVIKEVFIYSTIGFLLLILVDWASNGTDLIPMLCYVGRAVRVVGVFEQVFLIFLDIVTNAVFFAVLAVLFAVATKSRVLPILCTILFSRLGELEAIKDLMREVAQTSMGLYNIIFSNHLNLCQYLGYTQLVVAGTNFAVSYVVLLAYIAAMFAASMLAFNKQRAMK